MLYSAMGEMSEQHVRTSEVNAKSLNLDTRVSAILRIHMYIDVKLHMYIHMKIHFVYTSENPYVHLLQVLKHTPSPKVP